MKLMCKIFGHKWSFPMHMLRGDKAIGTSDYICGRCDKIRASGDLSDNGNPFFGGGGWRVRYD